MASRILKSLLVIPVAFVLFNWNEVGQINFDLFYRFQKSCTEPQKASYCFHHSNKSRYKVFEAVDNVLMRLDLEKTVFNSTSFHKSKCDLLWSLQFHDIEKDIHWKRLGYFRKVNHIPGNFYLTSKSILGKYTASKYIPKSFTDSKSLQEYAEKHPEKKFVVKLKSNRGIKLVNVSEVTFSEDPSDLNGYFGQEFIDNPLLFNGRKFDFGIYVVITSVHPLRLYYYTKNIIMRFCRKDYSISDPDDIESYIIGADIDSVWEFNGTKRYFDNDYSTKDAFEVFLENVGANITDIWWKIEDAIRSIVLSKEIKFAKVLDKIKSSTFNHFELFRFDMLLDSNLNLYIIEINQHPNIYPGPPHKPNRFTYENLLYNLFNLIGIGTTYRKSSLKPPKEMEMMIVHPNSLQIMPQVCASETCQSSCNGSCEICLECQNVNQRYSRFLAFNEQLNIGEFKRLFPTGDKVKYNLTKETADHAEWFREMCRKNARFC